MPRKKSKVPTPEDYLAHLFSTEQEEVFKKDATTQAHVETFGGADSTTISADLSARLNDYIANHGFSPVTGTKMCSKTRTIVARVHHWLDGLGLLLGRYLPALSDPLKLTEAATGIGKKGIQLALGSDLQNSFGESVDHDYCLPRPKCRPRPMFSDKILKKQSPGSKSQRFMSQLSNPMMVERIRFHIHRLYKKDGRIVLSELNEFLRNELKEFEYTLSKTSLWRLLQAMGFRYRKVSNRCVIYEKPELVQLRHTYILRVKALRDQNAYLAFTDETWIFEGMKSTHDWVDTSVWDDPMHYIKMGWKLGPDPTASRGKRAIVIGTITETGVLDGSFKAWTNAGGIEDGDYHRTMDAALFEQYLHTVCPLLVASAKGRKPVLILDNATTGYFLGKYNIPCSSTDKEPVLLQILSDFYISNGGKNSLKQYIADRIAASYGVSLLRLPPYHCVLNPIEQFWGYLKGKLTQGPTRKLEEMRQRAITIINDMPASMKAAFFANAEHVEDDFVRKEGIVFVSPVPMIIDLRGSASDDDLSDVSCISLNSLGLESSDEEEEFLEEGEEEKIQQLAKYVPAIKRIRKS